jgi:hypothetical protein
MEGRKLLQKLIEEHDGELPIGAIVNGKFSCSDCVTSLLEAMDENNVLDEVELCPIWRINIGDYKQSCSVCQALVVKGKTPSWPELF